jgi:predicted TIM-barrel fold metal-dependent hydrolase
VTISRRGFLAGAAAVGAGACAHHELAGGFPPAHAEGPPNYVVDVHCHIFNGSDLPIAGFVEKVAGLPPALADAILRKFEALIDAHTPSGATEIQLLATGGPPAPIPDVRQQLRALAFQKLDELLIPAATKYGGDDIGSLLERFVDTVNLVIRYRYQIAAQLAATYKIVDLFTPAMVDYDGWSNDSPKTPIAAQIVAQKLVSQLSIRGQLPGAPSARIHPLAPYNPLREVRDRIADPAKYDPFGTGKAFTADTRYDCAAAPVAAGPDGKPPDGAGALALARYAVEEAGFVGVKVYPVVGFLPLGNQTVDARPENERPKIDLALRALYAYAEAEQVPIMSHTGNSNGFGPDYGLLTAPNNWLPVLGAYPRLRLNLAHFGDLQGADNDRGAKACEAWIRQAAVLMKAYPNVYADVGCSTLPVYKDWAARYMDVLKDLVKEFEVVKKRLMFGTDFWLNGLFPNHELFVDAFTIALEDAFGAEVRRDMMGRNALRFLGFLDDAGKPANTRPAQRLRAFYGTAPRPGWLG